MDEYADINTDTQIYTPNDELIFCRNKSLSTERLTFDPSADDVDKFKSIIVKKLNDLIEDQKESIKKIEEEQKYELDEFVKTQLWCKSKFEKLQSDELFDFIESQKLKINNINKENKEKIIQYGKYLHTSKLKKILLEDENKINHKCFVVKNVSFDSSKNIYYSDKYNKKGTIKKCFEYLNYFLNICGRRNRIFCQ